MSIRSIGNPSVTRMVAVASLRSPGSSPSRLIAIPYRTYRHEPGYGVAQPFACDVLRTLELATST